MSLYANHAETCDDYCTPSNPYDGGNSMSRCSDGLAIWTLEAQTIVDREHIKALEAARVADAEAFRDLDSRLTVALTEIMNAVARENDAAEEHDRVLGELRDTRAELSRVIRERDRKPEPVKRGGVLRRFPRAVKGAIGLLGVARDLVVAAKARRTE